eukprot:3704269-Amphidinium_carterae.1
MNEAPSGMLGLQEPVRFPCIHHPALLTKDTQPPIQSMIHHPDQKVWAIVQSVFFWQDFKGSLRHISLIEELDCSPRYRRRGDQFALNGIAIIGDMMLATKTRKSGIKGGTNAHCMEHALV